MYCKVRCDLGYFEQVDRGGQREEINFLELYTCEPRERGRVGERRESWCD